MKKTILPLTRLLSPRSARRLRQFLGWCVHFYTALGLVAAAGIAVCIVEGSPASFRWAFVLMLAATVIDATDGTFARAVRIKEAVPNFDGRRLDDLVDFLTYTFLPLLLVWRADILPHGQQTWLLVPLIASAYGFCQVSAKTDDGYFLGFPSYWNLVAFYLYLLHAYIVPLPGWVSLSILVGFAVLTFVPTRYLYPSQKGRLNLVTNLLGAIWTVLLVWLLYRLPADPGGSDALTRGLILVSLLFPAYYLAASWVVSFRLWGVRRRGRATGRPREESMR
jgi:phosphatidylcholine synthase